MFDAKNNFSLGGYGELHLNMPVGSGTADEDFLTQGKAEQRVSYISAHQDVLDARHLLFFVVLGKY